MEISFQHHENNVFQAYFNKKYQHSNANNFIRRILIYNKDWVKQTRHAYGLFKILSD